MSTAPSVQTPADRMSRGQIGMWFFLASEVMLFVGLIGGYLVLRSANADLFGRMSAVLDRRLALVGTAALVASSVTMFIAAAAARRNQPRRASLFLLFTVLCAAAFIAIGAVDYRALWKHEMIVAQSSPDKGSPVFVYDGRVQSNHGTSLILQGWRRSLPERDFDIHLAGPDILQNVVASNGSFEIPLAQIVDRTNYFPWKNNFFASFFTLTGVHGAHVMGGALAIFLLWIQAARGRLFPAHIEIVSLYWHFVDLVWIGLFTLFYLM